MQIIGLCGSSGAGKSSAARIFASLGIPIIDADAVYRDLLYPYSPLIADITKEFGGSVINDDGTLNRRALAALVFSPEGKRVHLPQLNAITHGAVIAETEVRIGELAKNGQSRVIFDAPLLFESGFDKKCDIIISVVADMDIRIGRLVERDGLTRDQAKDRISSQLSDEYLISRSDYCIVNNGTADELYSSVVDIVEKITEK